MMIDTYIHTCTKEEEEREKKGGGKDVEKVPWTYLIKCTVQDMLGYSVSHSSSHGSKCFHRMLPDCLSGFLFS